MYISRLVLNPCSTQVKQELKEPYQLHRTVMSAFPVPIAKEERVLFRVDEHLPARHLHLLVQSVFEPHWPRQSLINNRYLLPEEQLVSERRNLDVISFEPCVSPGQVLTFRLRANPTIKKKVPGRINGKREGIRDEAQQIEWLRGKLAKEAGSKLLWVQTYDRLPAKSVVYRGNEKHNLEHLSVRFDGILQVLDPNLLLIAVKNGIGSGKGLGFGLLSLAPLRSSQ